MEAWLVEQTNYGLEEHTLFYEEETAIEEAREAAKFGATEEGEVHVYRIAFLDTEPILTIKKEK